MPKNQSALILGNYFKFTADIRRSTIILLSIYIMECNGTIISIEAYSLIPANNTWLKVQSNTNHLGKMNYYWIKSIFDI